MQATSRLQEVDIIDINDEEVIFSKSIKHKDFRGEELTPTRIQQ